MFDEKDLEQFKKKGTSAEKVKAQLELIKKGFPFLELDAAASVGNGIIAVDDTQCDKYIKAWDAYCTGGKHTITKFVPASGAASRMFKDLFGFLDAAYDVPTTPFEKNFFDNIEKFAFYRELDDACIKRGGKSIKKLMADAQFKAVVANLLGADGLNYGALPKGLLKFHKYGADARTPLEEHMAEGALYATGSDGSVNIHLPRVAPRLCQSATAPLTAYRSPSRNPAPIQSLLQPTALPSVTTTVPYCSVPEVTALSSRT